MSEKKHNARIVGRKLRYSEAHLLFLTEISVVEAFLPSSWACLYVQTKTWWLFYLCNHEFLYTAVWFRSHLHKKFALLVHYQVLGGTSNVFAHETQRNQLSWGFYGDILLWEMHFSVCEISFFCLLLYVPDKKISSLPYLAISEQSSATIVIRNWSLCCSFCS